MTTFSFASVIKKDRRANQVKFQNIKSSDFFTITKLFESMLFSEAKKEVEEISPK